MVSSGISGSINPVRPVDAAVGNTVKNQDADFGAIMSQQTLSAGADFGKSHSAGQNVQNTKTLMNTASTSKTEQRVKDVSEKRSQNETENVTGNEEISDKVSKVSEKGKEAIEDIRDKIKDEFGVTDEDIEKALEALGMTVADLFDESNLTDFVVELTGLENTVELLVSPEISAQLSEISDFIGQTMTQLSEELDIPVEELGDLLKEAEAVLQEPPVDETTVFTEKTAVNEAVSTEDDTSDSNEKPDAGQLKQKTDTETAQPVKEITVKVEKPQNNEAPDGRSHNDFTKNDGTQQAVNPVVDNFTNAVNEVFEMRGLDEGVNAVQVIEQIVEAAKITLNQEVTSMELMLNPESLGKIHMTVSVKEGIVTAALVAQNEAAKEAIQSQIVLLKENLNNQGIKVEAVEVTVESHAFEPNTDQGQNNGFNEQREQERKKSNRPLRLDSLDDLDMDELTEDERIVMDMMANDGNQVNFTA